MKKIYLSLATFLLPMLMMAQVALKPAVGFNLSNVSKDPASGEVKGQMAWQAGASVLIGRKFYIEPGVFYVKKNTEYTGFFGPEFSMASTTNSPVYALSNETVGYDDFNFNLTGVRIPVTVGLSLLGNESSLIGLRVFGGGSMFIVTNVDHPVLEKKDFNSPTWGVYAGAGLDIWIFFLDLKYEWSLTDATSIESFDIGKYRSFYTNLGVRIRF